jgi:hypothetical protein
MQGTCEKTLTPHRTRGSRFWLSMIPAETVDRWEFLTESALILS